MAHTSVELAEVPNADDLEPVIFGVASSPGFVVLVKTDSNRWRNANAATSEILAGKDGVGLLLHSVDTVGGTGVIVRPKQGRQVQVRINALGTNALGQVFVLSGSAAGEAVKEDSTTPHSGWWKTSVGVGGSAGTTDTVDLLYLDFHVSGQQVP